MKKSIAPHFSKKTFEFIQKAYRQKSIHWLDKNRTDYETVLQKPLQHLAQYLAKELAPHAPGYHFPLKGLARIKRAANRQAEHGSVYKDWISYSVSRPRESRFDHHPNLYFMIYPDDPDGDEVLVAGGLYMPSSRQLRSIREAIARDASPFERLFATKSFAQCFKGGFSTDKKSTRNPRGFDPNHPKMDWLRLQAYFVWRSYSKKEFFSRDFCALVARDWKQILRLNELLDNAIDGHTPAPSKSKKRKDPDLLSHLNSMDAVIPRADF